jgi:hypothetical protein
MVVFMISKKFNKTYDDALTQAYLFQTEFVIDQADFEAFSGRFADPFADDFLALINAADDLPNNENDLNNQTLITSQLEQKMEECRLHYQKLLLHVGFAYPGDDSILKRFGNLDYNDARRVPSKLIDLLQDGYREANSVTYKAALIAEGFVQLEITKLDTLADELKAKLNEQKIYIRSSSMRADQRAEAFNKVWDSMTAISNASKMMFKGSPSKVEFYLLYPESAGPGMLTAPQGLRFDFSNLALYWESVENASSFQVEASIDGTNYFEIYAGSDLQCPYTPVQDGWMWYRVRAHNYGGYGDWSSVLKQGYYDGAFLPPPENLAVELVSGTTNSVKLTWDVVPSATRYLISKSEVAVGAGFGPYGYIGDSFVNEYIATVDSGHRYYYHLNCENSNQSSPVSGDVFIDVN